MKSKQLDLILSEKKVVAPTYDPIPVVLSHGNGVWLFDTDERRYLDMISAYSAASHGHCHPELIETLKRQSEKLTICSRAFYSDQLEPFLDKITYMTCLEMVLPMNTGAEAVETAIKVARRWGYQEKGIPENQAEIIVCNNNFHGRTTTLISLSTQDNYQRHFGPYTPGFKAIPFGDTDAFLNAITPNTCAFIFEPMQGEAGIILPKIGWLKEVRDACNHHNVLMILDEIQTGLARTGALFAYHHDFILPDGVILGKALGGGILPVSAFVSKPEILKLMGPGSHGSTFGGNPLAAAVGRKALEILERDNYVERSRDLGNYLIRCIRSMNHPLVTDVRGSGLWVGVEINPQLVSARDLCLEMMSRGVLTKETHNTVIRLSPPLVIKKSELDMALGVLKDSLDTLFRLV